MTNSGTVKNRLRFFSSFETGSSWISPPKDLALANDEVHVWLSSLRRENAEGFEEIISSDERVKANRFRLPEHRSRFIAGRGILRIILAGYLRIKPEQIGFEYNLYGKPSMCGKLENEINFNLSHSGELAVYAFSRERKIGIDIESVQAFSIDERTAARCLTSRETEFLSRLPENLRTQFFFNCWTQKEAYLKGCGKGLSFPANQIETLFSQESATVTVLRKEENCQKKGWSIRKLPSIEGYAAALAVEGSNFKVSFWNSDFN